MKKIVLFLFAVGLALLPLSAFAQNNCTKPSSTCSSARFIAGAQSGASLTLQPNTYINFNGPSTTGRIQWNSGTGGFTFESGGVIRVMTAGAGAFSDIQALRYISPATSGTNGFELTVDGARMKFGASANAYWDWINGGVHTPGSLTTDGNFSVGLNAFSRNMSFSGTTEATFGTCNATAPLSGGTRGVTYFDTTFSKLRYCDGTSWVIPLTAAPTEQSTWTAFKPGAISEAAPLVGPLQAAKAGTVNRIACTWDTAGSGGTTAITVRVFDVTAAASLGTFTLGACNTAAHVPLIASGAGALTATNNYRLEVVSSGDCTTKPSNLMCNVNVAY